MATTDLKPEAPGTLARPGPVGRLVRLGFGVLCAGYVFGLVETSADPMLVGGRIRPFIWNGVIIGIFLISYVIDIGFSRDWKKWPAVVSVVIFLGIAGWGYLSTGTVETVILAHVIRYWELYLFSHLGLAFLTAAAIATPGCEMRAFHDLYSRLTGKPTAEHHCPVGPLRSIDRWESGRKRRQ